MTTNTLLDLLLSRPDPLESFRIPLKTENRKYSEDSSFDYKATTLKLYEVRGGKSYKLATLDTGLHDMWGGHLKTIMIKLQPLLADEKSYKWEEVRDIVVQFWQGKIDASVATPKKDSAKTIWAPGGDYTLGRLGQFISQVYISKIELIASDKLVGFLDGTEANGFVKSFTESVLVPVRLKREILTILNADKTDDAKAQSIVDALARAGEHPPWHYDSLINPSYEDVNRPVNRSEDRELKALWNLYQKQERRIKAKRHITEAEERLEINEFWESPVGKRLNSLNAKRVHGGGMSFEEKEAAKSKTFELLSQQMKHLLSSYGLSYSAVQKGLEHYTEIYINKQWGRWEQERSMRELVDKGRAEMNYVKEMIQGEWDSNSLTLFGVIISIALSFGFGLASIVPAHKLLIGIGAGLLSVLILTSLVKWKPSRMLMVSVMKKTLKR